MFLRSFETWAQCHILFVSGCVALLIVLYAYCMKQLLSKNYEVTFYEKKKKTALHLPKSLCLSLVRADFAFDFGELATFLDIFLC